MSKAASVVGLLANLVGVLLLFRYGMPYRIETKGRSSLLLQGTDKDAIKAESSYRRLGNLGLILVSVGTLLQVWGTYQS